MTAPRWLCAPHDSQQRMWLLLFDDPTHDSMIFTGYGAEAAARRAFAKKSRHWNCYLLATARYVPALGGEE